MKRITTLICAALLFAACNNAQDQQNTPAAPEQQATEQSQVTEKSPEQLLNDAINDYLVKEIGSQYAQGDVCIPALTRVATEDQDAEQMRVWGDFWIFNYKLAGDTLKTVSGGNHSGCITLVRANNDSPMTVTSFEQTVDGAGNVASAKRIFGQYYDKFQKVQSDQAAREAARKAQLKEYVGQHGLNARYYQDYGREAVAL